jgi:alkylation response protein AidB-like acyl-CoA dehydrogenase
MNFSFSEDQLLFRDSVRDFLSNEVTPEGIRELWESETGRSAELWAQLSELGLTGMLVSEDFGGLGMNEEDFILIAEECGRAALPEPLIDNAMIAVPLLQELLQATSNEKLKPYLEQIVSGESKVAIGHSANLLVSDAHIADLLLLQNDDEIHTLVLSESSQVELIEQESVDPSRKVFKVNWTPSQDTCVAKGKEAEALLQKTLNRGALSVAAQHLGLAQAMVAQCVEYTSERKQFGKPIGSFQAVKHHMANVAVKYEFAKAVVYRAANSIATNHVDAATHVAHAKIAASDAALLAAKHGIQVHGAMGYTWEVNLHIWMKRAWALDNTWGSIGFHKKQVARKAFASSDEIGAGCCF